MKALVTGASGFIGSTLIGKLSSIGFDVYALMRRTSSPANLRGLKYSRVEGDLSDLDSLRHAVKGMNYVFHLAGVVSARKRSEYFEHNSMGTARLAQAVADTGPDLARFVYVSSLAAAGPASSLGQPKTEGDIEAPVSSYGKSKLKGERELLKFKGAYPISIVRPPIVYGPKDKGVFVMIQTVAKNLMPILRGSSGNGGDGHKHYSAVHSDDLCDGIMKAAMAANTPSGDTFFISGDGIHTYAELLGTIARHLGRDPFRISVPKPMVVAVAACLSAVGFVTGKSFPVNLDKLNEILPDYWICSNEKAKRVLGFAPRFNLDEGVADAIQWYKREGWV